MLRTLLSLWAVHAALSEESTSIGFVFQSNKTDTKGDWKVKWEASVGEGQNIVVVTD